MRILVVLSLLTTLLTGCSEPITPIRVLFVLGSPPYHDIVNLPPILEARLTREGGFAVTRIEPPSGKPTDTGHLAKLATLSIDQYDVILFYLNADPLLPDQEEGLERFLNNGGGLVALHGSSASFKDSELWGKVVGGRFIGHARGTSALRITFVDRMHPITAGINDFETTDEEYCHELEPTVARHVLGRFVARPPKSVCPDGPNEMMWTREFGRGRVFYNSLGHNVATWENEAWQRLVIQGIQWAAGRK